MSDDESVRAWGERLKLEELTLVSFRDVVPNTRLSFAPGVNVVLGQNATGKSTLLELIAAIIRGNLWAYAQEAFQLEYRMSRDGVRWIFWVENREIAPRLWDARASVEIVDGLGVDLVHVGDGFIRVDSAYRVEQPEQCIGEFSALRLSSVTEWCGAARLSGGPTFGLRAELLDRFGADFGWLSRIMENEFGFSVARAEEFGQLGPGQGVLLEHGIYSLLRISGSGDRAQDEFEALAKVSFHGFVFAISHAGIRGVLAAMGFDEAHLVFGPAVTWRRGAWGSQVKMVDVLFTRGSRRIGLDALSYGQRRLFSIAFYLALNEDFAVLDEFADGLHESWLELAVGLLGDRQVFVTSQNRVAVDLLPFETADDVRRGFLCCSLEADTGRMKWEPLSEPHREALVRAREPSKTTSLTDVLDALGLW